VAVNGHIHNCDRLYRLKRPVSLDCSFESERNGGCPGCCHKNVVCYLPMQAANSRDIYVCYGSPIGLPKMKDWKSLALRWRSFSQCGRQCVTFHVAYNGSLYLTDEPPHPIDTLITQDVRPKFIDSPLTLNFRLGQGAVFPCFWS